jgi:glycosyltransferase involved in cell wall biosynthesis
MKIGVDAGALGITDDRLKVGVYRVVRNLLRELGTLDTKNQYILYSFDPIDRGVMSEFGPNMDNKILWPVKGWFTFRLPLELRLRPVDVFLGLSQALPRLPSRTRTIGLVHDLGFLYYPAVYSGSAQKLTHQTERIVKHADQIITVSEFVKQDIIKQYHHSGNNITVSHLGIDGRINSEQQAFHATIPYIVFVGSLNKAKDLPLALQSFALALKKLRKPIDYYLIGGEYWPDPNIEKTINQYGLQNRVKKLGVVSDAELAEYYSGALAFFTTPLHEGCCLPAVEAMSCGTPVVSINRGAMQEIVGNGGLIAKTLSPLDIADALYHIVSDGVLRNSYKKNALKQTKKYSWTSFAKNIHALIARYEY